MRFWGFLIVEISSNVSNVRIRQANNLTRIAGIGENFLISRKAGIEDDFSAAPGDCSRGPSVENFSIFKRQNSGSRR